MPVLPPLTTSPPDTEYPPLTQMIRAETTNCMYVAGVLYDFLRVFMIVIFWCSLNRVSISFDYFFLPSTS